MDKINRIRVGEVGYEVEDLEAKSRINEIENSCIKSSDIVQTTGDSIDKVMSQKAVTEKLDWLDGELDRPRVDYNILDWISGYYVTNKLGKLGNLITDSSAEKWYHIFIDVKQDDSFYVYLLGGSKARGWVFLNGDEIVQYSEDITTTIDQTLVIPSGVTRLLLQTQSKNTTVAHRFEKISKISSLTKTVTDASLYKTITTDVIFENKDYAYTGTIGTEPEYVSYKSFECVKIDNLKEGDTFEYTLHGGSTYKVWYKLKDGKIVQRSDTSYNVYTGTIVCDGYSFDSIIFNNYYGHQAVLKQARIVAKTDYLEERTDYLEGKIDIKEDRKRTIKILCFGNSFTQDSMCYVPHILKNIAPQIDLTLGIAYIGGCPLVQHYVNFSGEEATLSGTTYSVKNYIYYKSINSSSWVTTSDRSVDNLLGDEDWDIVTFQQAGGSSSKDFDTYYAPYIYKIHQILFNKITKNIKIGWLSIHGTYSSTVEGLLSHFTDTMANTRIVENTTPTSIIFPYGTAIQNLRSVPGISELGDYKNLQADSGHLQDGLGCLCAAYCNTLKILECLGYQHIGVIGESTRISVELLNSINAIGRHLGESSTVVGMQEDYVYLAQVAAHKAIQNPYEVTDISSCLAL